jgi:5-methylthioribose kinase
MLELTEQNAAEVLHARGHLTDPHTAKVRELSGGVSNAVFLIEQDDNRFVVKQARGKLRVAADWQCSVERIWREVEVLCVFDRILNISTSVQHVPKVLWTDRELYAYAMTAASSNASTWKELLLAGTAYSNIAFFAGEILAEVHAQTWHQGDIAEEFADRTFFRQLRLEPYYLAAAEKHPPLANQLLDLVDQTWEEQHALVHGDFSPKNILVDGYVFLIDFEVGHYGDPAFDVGFCLTHLVLKAIHLLGQRAVVLLQIHEFWRSYGGTIRYCHDQTIAQADFQRLESRCIQNLAGCLVARVHGKSPVDYLTPAEQLRAVKLSEELFALGPAANWKDAYELLQREIGGS